MTQGQRLAEFTMDSLEEDRKALELMLAIAAATLAIVAGLLLPLGPLLY